MILIRQPEATLRSLINLFGWQEKVALDYYVSELKALTEYDVPLKISST